MRSLHIALAFIRVPRLFVSLFLWPLLVGLLIVVVQTVFSGGVLKVYDEDSSSFRKRMDRESQNVFLRELLYGTDTKLPAAQICRWQMTPNGEVPPSADCAINKTDVVVKVAGDPATFDIAEYQHVFDGATHRIHICRTCHGSLEADLTGEQPVTNIYTLTGIGVTFLSDSERFSDISGHLVAAMDAQQRLEELEGVVLLKPPGLRGAINLTTSKNAMILIMNVAVIVIVAAWLALKAHRRVLDYFVKNEALLPLVAACGKNAIYKALWILSLSRVTLFLISAIVPLYLIFVAAGKTSGGAISIAGKQSLLLWMACIIFGLSTVTIVVSVADLKQRYSFGSILYRVGPFLAWLVGTSIWIATLLIPGTTSAIIQKFIIATPILGLSPIILAPIVSVEPTLLGAHALMAIMLTLVVMSRNTNWFAAHLEEL